MNQSPPPPPPGSVPLPPFAPPPPTPPSPPLPAAGATRSSTFWRRRGKLGKAALIGGGLLVGLAVLGAVLPTPDEGDVHAVDAASPSAPVTSELPAVSFVVEQSVEDEAVVEIATAVTNVRPVAADTVVVSVATVAEQAVVPTAPPTVTATPPLTVAHVVDGDTVDMSDGTTIRLIGIDTPERGECGADEATDTLATILGDQQVILVPGARDDVDRYGRLLRYIDLADGTDVDLAMIESGHAIARYDSRDGYGRHTREDAYVAADAVNPDVCAVPVTTPPPPPVAPPPAAVPAPAPVVALPPPAPVQQPATNVSYRNCDAVRAAGAAPIRPGDPGFQSKFDRDNDGIGCE